MKVVSLDKSLIQKSMWDGATGGHVLTCAPDGERWRVGWIERNRAYNPWPKEWLMIPIPALFPDGAGIEYWDALEVLKGAGKLEEATVRGLEICEAVEVLAPDEWGWHLEESLDMLADTFLESCNGAWEYVEVFEPGHDIEERRPDVIFEWEQGG